MPSNAPAVAMAMRAQALQAELFRNVSTPSVYMKAPHKISKETADRLRTDWQGNFGQGRRGSTAVLGEGLEVGMIDVGSAVDAELSKQFEFGVAEVARTLGVPLTLLQQPAGVTHGASVEETRSFASMSLAPFCRRVADELAQKLLTATQRAAGWTIEFDLSTMLISPAEVADRYSKLVNGGLMSTNGARELLGLPDVEAGDLLRVPVNVAPLENWVNGNTPAQQLAHPDTPANPQEASYTSGGHAPEVPRPLRAV
jgi:HK97 family phage portal protein